jgi:hypothetical protein
MSKQDISYLARVQKKLNNETKEIIEVILRDLLIVHDYRGMCESFDNVVVKGHILLEIIKDGIDEDAALKKGIDENIIKWLNTLSIIYGLAINRLSIVHYDPFDWEYLTIGKIQYGNNIQLKLDIFRYDKGLLSLQGDVESIFALISNISAKLNKMNLSNITKDTKELIVKSIESLTDIVNTYNKIDSDEES